jgi:cephalosporin hydroxylase
MKVRGFETDKDLSGYVDTYKGLALTLPPDASICELGVYGGGSLAFWQELFPQASVVVGVDINPGATWPPGTVKIVSDQQDPTLPDQLLTTLASEALGKGGYDLIVDDASHQGHLTYKALQHLWPMVNPGGYYVIEDWCVWNDAFPAYDNSMLALAQMLPTFFDTPETSVHFVSYQYGLIVLRKKGEVGDTRGDS